MENLVRLIIAAVKYNMIALVAIIVAYMIFGVAALLYSLKNK